MTASKSNQAEIIVGYSAGVGKQVGMGAVVVV